MSLDVTPSLIHELHDHAQQTGRPADTGIVLTPEGWQVQVWTNRCVYPIAMTAEDVHIWLDGNDLDDDAAQALAECHEPGLTYAVDHESGVRQASLRDVDLVVVTGLSDDEADQDPGSPMWSRAWWFDLAQARELITAPPHALNQGQAESLWLTAGGRYVVCRESIVNVSHTIWYELIATEVAERVYSADPDLVTDANDLPDLVTAALASRALIETITLPPVRRTHLNDGVHTRVDLDAAATAFVTATAITELVRTKVLPALGGKRREAAKVMHADTGNTAQVLRYLQQAGWSGSRRTLDDLLDN